MDKKKLSALEVADAWAFYTIKIWREKLVKLRIGHSGSLESSFVKEVLGAPDGRVIAIRFEFLYYGKFTDMGVGRGTPLTDVRENRTSRLLEGRMTGNRRRPKKWYGKTFYAEVARLREIMFEEFAHRGALVISENIGDNAIR